MPGIILMIGLLNISDADVQFCCYGQDIKSDVTVNEQISHISLSNVAIENIPITNYKLRIPNYESLIVNHESRIKNWIKPCLITAGIGLTIYGLYRIRGR